MTFYLNLEEGDYVIYIDAAVSILHWPDSLSSSGIDVTLPFIKRQAARELRDCLIPSLLVRPYSTS
jgi:hypothetical protein